MNETRRRRIVTACVLSGILIGAVLIRADSYIVDRQAPNNTQMSVDTTNTALAALDKLQVKGRAPKTGYTRAQFGDGWATKNGCDTRNIILARDLSDKKTNSACQLTSGTLNDPYTGKTITYVRGPQTSAAVQIDHVVALGDAWQTGAQGLTFEKRVALANDPLELLAVDGPANQEKSDSDAASWLPPNKVFRCGYVARQIAVKFKYSLWVTTAEHDAMKQVLSSCREQMLPSA